MLPHIIVHSSAGHSAEMIIIIAIILVARVACDTVSPGDIIVNWLGEGTIVYSSQSGLVCTSTVNLTSPGERWEPENIDVCLFDGITNPFYSVFKI